MALQAARRTQWVAQAAQSAYLLAEAQETERVLRVEVAAATAHAHGRDARGPREDGEGVQVRAAAQYDARLLRRATRRCSASTPARVSAAPQMNSDGLRWPPMASDGL